MNIKIEDLFFRIVPEILDVLGFKSRRMPHRNIFDFGLPDKEGNYGFILNTPMRKAEPSDYPWLNYTIGMHGKSNGYKVEITIKKYEYSEDVTNYITAETSFEGDPGYTNYSDLARYYLREIYEILKKDQDEHGGVLKPLY